MDSEWSEAVINSSKAPAESHLPSTAEVGAGVGARQKRGSGSGGVDGSKLHANIQPPLHANWAHPRQGMPPTQPHVQPHEKPHAQSHTQPHARPCIPPDTQPNAQPYVPPHAGQEDMDLRMQKERIERKMQEQIRIGREAAKVSQLCQWCISWQP